MKTFDYRSAWHQAARPAYEALPQEVRDLLADTAAASEGVGQLADLSMPWPAAESEYRDLRACFDKVPPPILALAAQAIHNVGHWYPRDGNLEVPGRKSGACWKFAHYADQSLRARLQIGNGDNPGTSIRLLEGALRLCYSSREMWSWIEVAPATETGVAYARGLQQRLLDAIIAAQTANTGASRREKNETADQVAYQFMEDHRRDPDGWPDEWRPLVNTEQYMVEEAELIELQKKLDAPDPAKLRADLIARIETKIANLKQEQAGYLWLIDHGYDTENAIYYTHTGRWCFGWRTVLTAAAISKWLDALVEFPYPYDIKGYTPEPVKA